MELHLKELNHVGCKLIKAVSRTTDIVVENRQFKKTKNQRSMFVCLKEGTFLV